MVVGIVQVCAIRFYAVISQPLNVFQPISVRVAAGEELAGAQARMCWRKAMSFRV